MNVQIAHVDRDPTNNSIENLVPLCPNHHDEYDSVSSQTKRILPEELKKYRELLCAILDQKDERVRVQFVREPGATPSFATPSAKLLGEIVACYDFELAKHDSGGRPNGIQLLRCGAAAIERYGDFDVALETFASLVRLSVHVLRKDGFSAIVANPPSATPALAAAQLLQKAGVSDSGLARRMIQWCRVFALTGSQRFDDVASYDRVPHQAYDVVAGVFTFLCTSDGLVDRWMKDALVRELALETLSIGTAILIRGIPLPSATEDRWIDPSGQRTIAAESPREHLPLVRLVTKLVTLGPSQLAAIVEHLKYRHCLGAENLVLDPENGMAAEEARAIVGAWALLPGYAKVVGQLRVADSLTLDQCKKSIEEATEKGVQACRGIRALVNAESNGQRATHASS